MKTFKKVLPYLHTYNFPTSQLTDEWVELILKAWEENDHPTKLFIPELNQVFGPLFLSNFMEYWHYGNITDLNRIMVHIQNNEKNNFDVVREWDGVEGEEGWNITSVVYLTDIEEDIELVLEFPNTTIAKVKIEPNLIYQFPSFTKYKLAPQSSNKNLLEMSWGVSVDSDTKHLLSGDEW